MIGALLHDVDALLLDWDGTIADTVASNYMVLSQVLAHHGLRIDRDWYNARVGLALADLLDQLGELLHRPVPATSIIATCRTIRTSRMHPMTSIPSVMKLLDGARALGLPCAIASGASRRIVETGISALHLENTFRAVITREDVAHGKPAPDLFLAAAEAVDAQPRRCIAVDDAIDGITAAYAAGIGKVLTINRGLLQLAVQP
ncbi:HAD family phosphatase [Catellatospora citrea]|uniref:HAD family hydrolase n=1 Tax=Catellatospora citrea TaxID=53366 RepID=UPI0034074299